MSDHAPINRDELAGLFPDAASAERALDRIDLKATPDEGLEQRTVAVFRVAVENEEAHQSSVRFRATRQIFRSLVLLVAVGLLAARWFSTGTHSQTADFSHNPVTRAWETIEQTFLRQPDYVARPPTAPDRRENRLLAAFHQLSADLIEIVIWAVAIIMVLLLAVDLWRWRRRPASDTQPVADGRT